MPFRTKIPPTRSDLSISHDDRVLCIGSCFAEHIGGWLGRLRFSCHTNPFGIVFNPISLAQTLGRVQSAKPFGEAELLENQGLWHSPAHHGRFSQPDRQAALDGMNAALAQSHDFLKKTNRLLLTLGTAHVFLLRKTGGAVANCHKLLGTDFDRRRLSVEEVAGALTDVLRQLKNDLPALEVVVTVSPVRHLRDGILENQRSKATLLLGLEMVTAALPFVRYFPAYELVMDDLRDYRFYEADMAHPNQQAVDYVWQYFVETYFSEETKALCQRIERLVTASGHRPLHPGTAAHQDFLRKQKEMLEQLQTECPALDFFDLKSEV